MPTYEYRCNACQREFEYQQKMSDPELVKCEACGEDRLEKLISWTSVRGSSWQDGLFSSNPREAMKGTTAIDRSKPPAKKPEPEAPAPEVAEAPLGPDDDDEDEDDKRED
jgi:putative FmdB family regulatory protein